MGWAGSVDGKDHQATLRHSASRKLGAHGPVQAS